MHLGSWRFDTSGEQRVPNTRRGGDASGKLPGDFPLVYDLDTGQIVEPILIFMRGHNAGPQAFKKGKWTKRASAVNVAADLRAWWTNLDQKGRDWRDVDDRFLSDYLKDLRLGLSGKTLDYLSEGTFKRRISSIGAFYAFAASKWQLTRTPSVANARKLVSPVGGSKKSFDAEATDSDPHPFSQTDMMAIGDALGPLPSERVADAASSRTRLAFELGVMTGLRVDEIVNLTTMMFKDVPVAGNPDGALQLRITHTKGLRPRTVYIPLELVGEIQRYIVGERAAVLAAARRGWLKGKPEPSYLLVNRDSANANRGKQVRTATIEEDFNAVVTMLGITRTRLAAEGTRYQREITEPRHVFHDCRHTYAVNTFDSLRPSVPGQPWKTEDPLGFVQRRLGHRDPKTTETIYLNVFKDLAGDAVEALMRDMRERRLSRRGAGL